MKLNFSFSLRGPDRVSEELATVLSKKGTFGFGALFDMVHANLRSRDLARGGEEMLRLRAYEKLQNFVQAGIAKRDGKEYSGVPEALEAFFATSAEFNARFASGNHCRAPLKGKDDKDAKSAPEGTAPKPVKAAARAKVAKAPKTIPTKSSKSKKSPAHA